MILLIYYNNKTLFLYKTSETEEAKKMIVKHKKLFDGYSTNINIASTLQDTIETITEER